MRANTEPVRPITGNLYPVPCTENWVSWKKSYLNILYVSHTHHATHTTQNTTQNTMHNKQLTTHNTQVDHGAVPPLHSVYHSIKQSFGSICLAALCIPPVKLLWGIMRPLSRVKQRSLTGLFERPYLWAETLYTYNNQYCFPKMIMYNMDFRSASGAVYRQFYERSVDSIVWYVKFSTLLFFPQIGGGCLLASITALWAKSAQVEHWYIISVTAFFVGYSTLALTTAVVGGVIHTVLACFAEFPQLLAETHPIIFHRFVRISEFSTFQDNRMDI